VSTLRKLAALENAFATPAQCGARIGFGLRLPLLQTTLH
jgi:hypothetical protein